jgi:hypothetical protein
MKTRAQRDRQLNQVRVSVEDQALANQLLVRKLTISLDEYVRDMRAIASEV